MKPRRRLTEEEQLEVETQSEPKRPSDTEDPVKSGQGGVMGSEDRGRANGFTLQGRIGDRSPKADQG